MYNKTSTEVRAARRDFQVFHIHCKSSIVLLRTRRAEFFDEVAPSANLPTVRVGGVDPSADLTVSCSATAPRVTTAPSRCCNRYS